MVVLDLRRPTAGVMPVVVILDELVEAREMLLARLQRGPSDLPQYRTTGEFTINVPGTELAAAIWEMPNASDRFALAGLTQTPGKTIAVPAIPECFAHLECVLDRIVEFERGEVFIFGTIRLIEVDDCMVKPAGIAERYHAAGTPFFFLEEGWYGPLGQPMQASVR